MEALLELETMADAAAHVETDEAVERWQRLFGYTPAQARAHLEQQASDPKGLVPTALWSTVQGREENEDHARASYSHWLFLQQSSKVSSAPAPPKATPDIACDVGREYLLKLGGPLDSAQKVREVGCLSATPKIFYGTSAESDEGNGETTEFCLIDGATKQALIAWLKQYHPTFRPLFAPRSVARKDFCAHSMAPMLGIDTTLPQHRLLTLDAVPRPRQVEYPVHYFFYGTLAEQYTLRRVLGHLDGDKEYELTPACVRGARLTTWGGKYKGVVDGEEEVEGWAFVVESEEQEEALRSYETAMYEVVRCRIVMMGREEREIEGCTFRFVGPSTGLR